MLPLPQPVPSLKPPGEAKTSETSQVMVTIRRAMPQDKEAIPLPSLQEWVDGKKSTMVVISPPRSMTSPYKTGASQKQHEGPNLVASLLKMSPTPVVREEMGTQHETSARQEQTMRREVRQIIYSRQQGTQDQVQEDAQYLRKEENRRRKERKKIQAFAITEQVRRYREEVASLQQANSQLEKEVSQLQDLHRGLEQAKAELKRMQCENTALGRRLCESEQHRASLVRNLFIIKDPSM